MIHPRSCVSKNGRFIVGIHTPGFDVRNLRQNEYIDTLGWCDDGTAVDNRINFPDTDLQEPGADPIYEIANPFSFRGTTYINSAWADAKAKAPDTIRIREPEPCSLTGNFKNAETGFKDVSLLIDLLPRPLLIALAQASTDPEELVLLARKSCRIHYDQQNGRPAGIGYKRDKDRIIPDILDPELFEVVVNNPQLPDPYKNALVLKPGVQGHNEITAEFLSPDTTTHVFEYLRRNSYIPWGHFASNMANDSVRYSAKELSLQDMQGIRHLYYQRAYVRMARALDIPMPDKRQTLTRDQLESLRVKLIDKLSQTNSTDMDFTATLWGWNFGFGYAPSGHRLHASHQMVHQQNAMIPGKIPTTSKETVPAFACGDQISEFIARYRDAHRVDFFQVYQDAIYNNTRTDGNKKGPDSLIVAEDEHILLFVPKAQVCDYELQLMPKTDCGNIFEAGTDLRAALDKAILCAVKTLESLGAKLITSIEFSKRLGRWEGDTTGQRLLYSFIPRLPYAPATFSEAQQRWICGLYPEDFARACRQARSDNRGGSHGDS
ncbi:MAG: hypothetical protein MI862_10350 [Desulfobacterales bacterium]|nr:hypothetical protein [Desulfobacterales bacterium]